MCIILYIFENFCPRRWCATYPPATTTIRDSPRSDPPPPPPPSPSKTTTSIRITVCITPLSGGARKTIKSILPASALKKTVTTKIRYESYATGKDKEKKKSSM